MSIYDQLKKYRSQIMGLAILWIMLYHSNMEFHNPILVSIKNAGYGGVDIFFVCSGFGIVHSLKKHDDITFFKHRMAKIFPVYYIFIIAYIAYHLIFGNGMDFFAILGNLTFTGWWTGYEHQFNWYVASLPFFYILGPIIYKILKDSKKPFRCCVIMNVIFVVMSVAVAGYGDKIMAVGRLPVYSFGIYWGLYFLDRKEVKAKTAILNAVLMVAGLVLLDYSLRAGGFLEMLAYGVPFMLIAPTFCVAIPYAIGKLNQWKVFEKLSQGIGFIGICSFEIYLVHIAIYKYFIYNKTSMNNWKWLGLYVVSLLIGILYHLCSDKMISIIKNRKAN